MKTRPSLSLIFLGRPLLRETLSACERWLLVLSHIRATDHLEISHFRAILRGDSPVFSLRNQTLARCSAEIFPLYTITYSEAVCSYNRLTVNLVYSLKYCTRDYATKQVLSYDEFIAKFVVSRCASANLKWVILFRQSFEWAGVNTNHNATHSRSLSRKNKKSQFIEHMT